MGHLKHSIHVDAPVDAVARYTEDPHNWATFMVGLSEPDRITGDGGVGTEYDLNVVMAGFHLHETGRVAEDRHDPDGSAHWRFDLAGTSAGWMKWDFRPENGGTLVTEEMEYTVPGSILGKVVDRLVYEKRQDRDMLHSLENIKLLLETSPAA